MNHEKQDGINGQWTCGVFIKTKTRTVLISEDLGKHPIYMKISGGRRRPQDKNIRDTATREALEETGLRIEAEDLILVFSQNRKSHMYHLFSIEIEESRLGECFTRAKNGETVHILSFEEFKQKRGDTLPHHLDMIDTNRLIP